MGDTARDALYEIMRQASYLPLLNPHRTAIENAASAALRELTPPVEGGDTDA